MNQREYDAHQSYAKDHFGSACHCPDCHDFEIYMIEMAEAEGETYNSGCCEECGAMPCHCETAVR